VSPIRPACAANLLSVSESYGIQKNGRHRLNEKEAAQRLPRQKLKVQALCLSDRFVFFDRNHELVMNRRKQDTGLHPKIWINIRRELSQRVAEAFPFFLIFLQTAVGQ